MLWLTRGKYWGHALLCYPSSLPERLSLRVQDVLFDDPADDGETGRTATGTLRWRAEDGTGQSTRFDAATLLCPSIRDESNRPIRHRFVLLERPLHCHLAPNWPRVLLEQLAAFYDSRYELTYQEMNRASEPELPKEVLLSTLANQSQQTLDRGEIDLEPREERPAQASEIESSAQQKDTVGRRLAERVREILPLVVCLIVGFLTAQLWGRLQEAGYRKAATYRLGKGGDVCVNSPLDESADEGLQALTMPVAAEQPLPSFCPWSFHPSICITAPPAEAQASPRQPANGGELPTP